MDEIAIVKRRSRVWPILLLLLVAIAVLAALWIMGYLGPVPAQIESVWSAAGLRPSDAGAFARI